MLTGDCSTGVKSFVQAPAQSRNSPTVDDVDAPSAKKQRIQQTRNGGPPAARLANRALRAHGPQGTDRRETNAQPPLAHPHSAVAKPGSTSSPPPASGKGSDPGSEPDANSEYMSEATATEDDAPRAPGGQSSSSSQASFSVLEAVSVATDVECLKPPERESARSTDSSRSQPSNGGQKERRQNGCVRRCLMCGTTESPKWRCNMTLCNACGLRKAKQSTGLMTHLDGPIFTNMFIPMPMGADPFMGAGTHTPFAAIQRHPNPYASFIGAVQGVDPIEQAAKAAATSLSRSSSQGLPAYLPPQTFSGYGLVGTPQLPVQMNNGTIPYHTQSVAAAGQPIMMPVGMTPPFCQQQSATALANVSAHSATLPQGGLPSWQLWQSLDGGPNRQQFMSQQQLARPNPSMRQGPFAHWNMPFANSSWPQGVTFPHLPRP